MRFLIVGSGLEEDAWNATIAADPSHTVQVRMTPSEDASGLAALESALTDEAVDAVILGGPRVHRAEALRRVAILGLPTICLHPPGDTADGYYQVALAHSEERPVVVPDLPLRLHPAVERIAGLVPRDERRHVSLEVTATPGAQLLGEVLPRVIDLVWSLAGPIETVMANATPPDAAAPRRLTLHLEGAGRLSAELRIRSDVHGPPGGTLRVTSGEGIVTWSYLDANENPSSVAREPESLVIEQFPPWDARRAVLDQLMATARAAPSALGIAEGIRAMEVAEGVARSLKRGRKVDMHYDEISELASFKANMTSIGCGLVIATLLLYVLSRIGLAFGFEASGYLAWAIFGLLALYAISQLLRFAARPNKSGGKPAPPAAR